VKIEADRKALLAACQAVAPFAMTRDTRPILRNFKIDATNAGHITLSATNLEYGLRIAIRGGCTVEEPGVAVLPHKVLESLRELRDEKVVIVADDATCTLRGLSAEFDMPTEAAGNFPDLPPSVGDRYHTVPNAALRQMVKRTQFATASGDMKFSATTGIKVELHPGRIVMVATSGRTLAMESAPATGSIQDSARQGGVLPAKPLTLLLGRLDASAQGEGEGASTKIAVGPNEAVIECGDVLLYSRIVEGRFPPYEQVIPKDNAFVGTVELKCGELLAAVRQAALMTDDTSVGVQYTFTNTHATLVAMGATTGKSNVTIPVVGTMDKPFFRVLLNPHYLTDMLKVMDGASTVQLGLIDAAKPVVFKQDSYRYVVVPLAGKQEG
jgi:DNA polymerase-3 subunit beta